MANGRSVVINGDLGSGKSTVSRLLARQLGIRRISVGDLYREMAARRGLTALQLNLHAELDDKIDHYVDRLQGDIAQSGERLVVDSRLAWHFFRDAVKVHLITDPVVAARRALGRPASTVESYGSVDEALRGLASRSESERVRFIERYGADKTRLENYDVVCDSTRAGADEIAARILEVLDAPAGPHLFIDPQRVDLSRAWESKGTDRVRLGYERPRFFAVEGHDAIAAAARDGQTLISATLAAPQL
ncbi:AAA family ATPase [Allorhizocola rhizosphaerae]|uniref:AAA family ATPase n=1 Tax=Allorhizocola rhizosphaerae TaxID=1872709 RepID=UPI000E3B878E|nr:AAA family ATPase [Allorhizocola rhizosphaerae]